MGNYKGIDQKDFSLPCGGKKKKKKNENKTRFECVAYDAHFFFH